MAADVFELNGWDTPFLGPNTPSGDLLDLLSREEPDLLGISLSIYFNLPQLIDLINRVASTVSRPRARGGGRLSDVIVDFAGKFTLETLREEETPSMWSVTTSTGLPKTFNFHFIDYGTRVISIGEHNHRDGEVLEANLIHLNREVGSMNRDLQKRTAELERLHEEKNRFMGIAAHDLRNPIGAIHSLTDHLLRLAQRKSYREHRMRGSLQFERAL